MIWLSTKNNWQKSKKTEFDGKSTSQNMQPAVAWGISAGLHMHTGCLMHVNSIVLPFNFLSLYMCLEKKSYR